MKKALDFLGLIDETGRLSRTNLAVYLALASIVVALARHGNISWDSLSVFLVAMVSYQAKRVIVQQGTQFQATTVGADQLAALSNNDAVQKTLLDNHTTAIAQVVGAVKNMSASLKARGAL